MTVSPAPSGVLTIDNKCHVGGTCRSRCGARSMAAGSPEPRC
jgi:hypothetical protein